MKYTVEISVNSGTDMSGWLKKHLINPKLTGVSILNVKPVNPNAFTTIDEDREAKQS